MKRDISNAVDTTLPAGTMPVSNRGSLVSSVSSSNGMPRARVSSPETGGTIRGPVGYASPTCDTSSGATPKFVQRNPSGSRMPSASTVRMSLPVARRTTSPSTNPPEIVWYATAAPGRCTLRSLGIASRMRSGSSSRSRSIMSRGSCGIPARCESTWAMVIASRPPPANSGR